MQRAAFNAIRQYLSAYDVETRGVYIQDVVFPEELVEVLTRREIATHERTTYVEQQKAETVRIEVEKAGARPTCRSSWRPPRCRWRSAPTGPGPGKQRPAARRPT